MATDSESSKTFTRLNVSGQYDREQWFRYINHVREKKGMDALPENKYFNYNITRALSVMGIQSRETWKTAFKLFKKMTKDNPKAYLNILKSSELAECNNDANKTKIIIAVLQATPYGQDVLQELVW